MTVLKHPLDVISLRARPYPAHMLPEGGTGLCLFAAAYLGHNDAIHFARKDMTVTCVDIDTDKLSDMSRLYPDDWTFVSADAWDFAKVAVDDGRQWDAVSVDNFTGAQGDRSLATLRLWCRLARSLVTVTLPTEADYQVPSGWRESIYPRSDIASWLVLTRE